MAITRVFQREIVEVPFLQKYFDVILAKVIKSMFDVSIDL